MPATRAGIASAPCETPHSQRLEAPPGCESINSLRGPPYFTQPTAPAPTPKEPSFRKSLNPPTIRAYPIRTRSSAMVFTKLTAALGAVLLACAHAAAVSRQVVPSASEEPMPSVSPDADPVCFPGSAEVTLASGASARMDALKVGDRVLTSSGVFSEVFMFTHRLSEQAHSFVRLDTAAGSSLRLTAGHYLYANGARVAAAAVRVGDELELADGSASRVVRVGREDGLGLFNPQTVTGDIVVDGVRASTFTTAVEPSAAQALLAPLRAAYEGLGLSTKVFDHGARLLATLAPKGSMVSV